jgi:energy-coupling factor transporter ATP-binding protein EcfA2
MNIKTFLACAALICASDSPKSILIQGPHGIGKSALARKLARTIKAKSTGGPLKLIDKRLAQLTEGDIIGLPFKNEEKKTTEWYAPDWIRMACEEPCLLFLDEGNRGTGEVLQASFQLVLDRCIGENKLHPDTRVFMAINNDTRLYQVADLDPAYRDRFWQCDLTPTVEEWLEWAKDETPEGGNIHKTVWSFVAQNHTALDPSDAVAQDEKQPSRRSWEGFNTAAVLSGWLEKDWKSLDAETQTVFTMLSHGYVGRDVGNQFIEYYKTLEAQVTALDVLDNWDTVKDRIVAMSQSDWNALSDRVVTALETITLTEDQAVNIGKFMRVLPGELRVAFWQETAKRHQNTTTNLKLMHNHINTAIVEAIGKPASST